MNSDCSKKDENGDGHHSYPYDRFDSPSSKYRRRDKRTADILGHELLILQTHDGDKDGFDTDIDDAIALNWTKESENWLHIGGTPLPLLQHRIEKKAFAVTPGVPMRSSPGSFLEDEKKQEQERSPSDEIENDKRGMKIVQTQMMQTQETSPTLEIHTETQTQASVQEPETQQSTAMSLLAYLNQPSPVENETKHSSKIFQPKIELLSRDDLLYLLPFKTQYPPNDSAFLCFEELSVPGETETMRYAIVKDTRLPLHLGNKSNQEGADGASMAKVDILRAKQGVVSVGWKALPRRKLTLLFPGDRIRITFSTSHRRPAMCANITIVLEYRHKQARSKQPSIHNFQVPAAGTNDFIVEEDEAKITIDTNVNDGDDASKSQPNILKKALLDETENHLSTFCGTTRRVAEEKPWHGRSGMLNREINSTVEAYQKTIEKNILEGSAVDCNASIAVDSTVNSQQESLRPTRLGLLDRNVPVDKNISDESEHSNEKSAKSARDSSPRNESNQTDRKDLGNNVQNELSMVTEEQKEETVDHTSDATLPYQNIHETGNSNARKDPENIDHVDDSTSSTATFAHCFTQETADPFGNKNRYAERESDDSSGATIPLYENQEPKFATDKKSNNGGLEKDRQSKIKLGCNVKDNFNGQLQKRDATRTENIPLNIALEDDLEDGERPPVSQLLLSMESDNENDDNTTEGTKRHEEGKKDDACHPQKSGSCKKIAERTEISLHPPNVAEKIDRKHVTHEDEQQIEGSEQATHETKDITHGVHEEIVERKDKPDSMQITIRSSNEGLESDAINATDGIIDERSDDETIVGIGVTMDDMVNSTKTKERKGGIAEDENDQDGGEQKCIGSTTEGNFNDKTPDPIDLNTEATNILCSLKNSSEKETSSVAESEKMVQSEVARRSGHKRKISTSEPTNSVTRSKRKRRSLDESKFMTLRNRNAIPGSSPYSSRTKKVRQSVTFTDDFEVARNADKLYERRFSIAIQRKAINVLVSGFDQIEMNRISKLCTTKFSNVSHFVIHDSIDDNITACILPTGSNDNEEANCRTLKAIQCALLGIPMISLACVERWRKERKITIPTSFVRSLASKVGRLTMKHYARYGVARLAAARYVQPEKPSLPFQNAFVFLCGVYTSEKKNNIIKLLKEGSATLMNSSREASAKLKTIMHSSEKSGSPQKRFVLLYGDRGKSIPKFLKKEIMAALEDSDSRKIYVVDSNWVSLSIACANMLPPADFEPNDGLDLWQLSKELPE